MLPTKTRVSLSRFLRSSLVLRTHDGPKKGRYRSCAAIPTGGINTMNLKRGPRAAQSLLAAPFLLLPIACSPTSGVSPGATSGSESGTGGSGNSNSVASGASTGASSGTTQSGNESGAASGVGSGAGSGTATGSGLDGAAGSGLRDGGTLNAADADAGPFVCPTLVVPGNCTPPADIRCPYPKLSQTGCVDPTNPPTSTLNFASAVVPYEVNSPLWSDGAYKTRGMRLPGYVPGQKPGQPIHVKNCTANPTECCVKDPVTLTTCLPPYDDGKWVFPVGTVMVKNFMFPDVSQPSGYKFVETRLFQHMDHVDPASQSDWVGYGYQWNDAQTDAVITGGSDPTTDNRMSATFHVVPTAGAAMQSITWNYPSRLDCMTCHTAITPSGGNTLGPETIQMNRVVNGTNQIDSLAAMSFFDVAPPKPYDAALVAPYPGQAGSPPPGATLDQRARSYLHANCSFCHRPDGNWNGMDLRFDTPLKSMGICNIPPGKGDLGVNGALLLTPANAMESVILLRMMAPPGNATVGDTGRMPEIGSQVVDTQATMLISQWIDDSITTCPM
jgi:hypothetical protein